MITVIPPDLDMDYTKIFLGGMNRIVFYELRMWVNSTTIIGCDPKFDRKEDIVIQTKLARPDLKIYTNLNDIVNEVAKLI